MTSGMGHVRAIPLAETGPTPWESHFKRRPGRISPLVMSTTLISPKPMVAESEFLKLHKACREELAAFYENSQQLLNVLVLAELFPKDIENQTALEYHFKVEIEAKQDYDRRRRDLFDFVVTRSLEDKALRKQRLDKP